MTYSNLISKNIIRHLRFNRCARRSIYNLKNIPAHTTTQSHLRLETMDEWIKRILPVTQRKDEDRSHSLRLLWTTSAHQQGRDHHASQIVQSLSRRCLP